LASYSPFKRFWGHLPLRITNDLSWGGCGYFSLKAQYDRQCNLSPCLSPPCLNDHLFINYKGLLSAKKNLNAVITLFKNNIVNPATQLRFPLYTIQAHIVRYDGVNLLEISGLTCGYYDTFGLVTVLGCFDVDDRTWLDIHHLFTVM